MIISIEDWPSLERLEDEIIGGIADSLLKMLKIMEFSFFWDFLFENYEHERK